MSLGSIVVVNARLVSTVTVPPFWASAMVTGPWAVGSWKLPVLPGLKLEGVSPVAPEPLPEPPHAARASKPTEDRATSGVLSLMYTRLSMNCQSRRALAEVHQGPSTRSARHDPALHTTSR